MNRIADDHIVLRTRPRRALDFGFVVEVDDARALAHLDDVLSGMPTGSETDPIATYELRGIGRRPHVVELRIDGQLLGKFVTPAAAIAFLLWHLNRQAVAASGRFLLLHAGAVTRRGSAIVLPAPMESGKTTLVTGLLQQGFAYVTDEAAAVDLESGMVTPYPKALHLDDGSWSLFPELAPAATDPGRGFVRDQWHIPPSRLGASVADPAPIGAVVFPRYRSGAATTLVPMRPVNALVEMIANSFNFPDHGRQGLDALAALLVGIPCRSLTVGDLDAACRLLAELDDQLPPTHRVPHP